MLTLTTYSVLTHLSLLQSQNLGQKSTLTKHPQLLPESRTTASEMEKDQVESSRYTSSQVAGSHNEWEFRAP